MAGYALGRKGGHTTADGVLAQMARSSSLARRSERWGTPAVQAHAANDQAWALAGNRTEWLRKLDEATELLTASAGQRGGEPPWVYWFTPEYLTTQSGSCYTKLGDVTRAIQAFDGAGWVAGRVRPGAGQLPPRPSPRRTRDGGDPEQAAMVDQEVAHIALGTGSERILGSLSDLHATGVGVGVGGRCPGSGARRRAILAPALPPGRPRTTNEGIVEDIALRRSRKARSGYGLGPMKSQLKTTSVARASAPTTTPALDHTHRARSLVT